MNVISEDQKAFFAAEGYLMVLNMFIADQVAYYSDLYSSFLDNSINASKYRSDLSRGE